MSHKIELDEIIAVLQEKKIEDTKIHEIVKELNAIVEENKNDKQNATPKTKSKFVVFIRGDEKLQKQVEQGAFIVQVKEDDKTDTLYARIQTAARAHNDSLKRAKTKVATFGDAMNFIKRKLSKKGEYMVKTKLPVEVQVVVDENII